MRYKVGVISLGCNKNRVDTETALGLLKEHGYEFTSETGEAELLLINTCGFIESAREESVNTILEMAQYKKTGRCRLLIVTGCLAQRYEKELLEAVTASCELIKKTIRELQSQHMRAEKMRRELLQRQREKEADPQGRQERVEKLLNNLTKI